MWIDHDNENHAKTGHTLTTPIDPELSAAVLAIAGELFPQGFDVSPSAPSTFEAAIEARDTVAGINALLDVPSLGLVKAAFVMQCLGAPDAACIDTHNLARLGLSYGVVKFGKANIKREATRLRRIRHYVNLCLEQGNARYWWNTWCDYVAAEGRKGAFGFASGADVSAEHCRAIGLA